MDVDCCRPIIPRICGKADLFLDTNGESRVAAEKDQPVPGASM